MAAVGKLLTGAKKSWTQSTTYRLYKKNGNQQSAIQDFYSVEPKLAKRKPNSPTIGSWRGRSRQALTGTVGDRRLILMPNGDAMSRHSPVLEIKSISSAYTHYDRIVYKSTGN